MNNTNVTPPKLTDEEIEEISRFLKKVPSDRHKTLNNLSTAQVKQLSDYIIIKRQDALSELLDIGTGPKRKQQAELWFKLFCSLPMAVNPKLSDMEISLFVKYVPGNEKILNNLPLTTYHKEQLSDHIQNERHRMLSTLLDMESGPKRKEQAKQNLKNFEMLPEAINPKLSEKEIILIVDSISKDDGSRRRNQMLNSLSLSSDHMKQLSDYVVNKRAELLYTLSNTESGPRTKAQAEKTLKHLETLPETINPKLSVNVSQIYKEQVNDMREDSKQDAKNEHTSPYTRK